MWRFIAKVREHYTLSSRVAAVEYIPEVATICDTGIAARVVGGIIIILFDFLNDKLHFKRCGTLIMY